MATTTPNFGWPVPTSTDLVKDGAVAIEGLGDAIDASLLDLKGGTTGQVLSKASNTDMDFTWATDASGIPATILDAKGDIIAATAADTASRLAVGTNGQVLTADSTAATGLKWAAAATSNANFSLISSVSLSGATTTVSGISGMNQIYVLINGASTTGGGDALRLRINTDTGANYDEFFGYVLGSASWAASNVNGNANISNTYLLMTIQSNMGANTYFGGAYINGCNTAGSKMVQWAGGSTAAGGSGQYALSGLGRWSGSGTVTSVSFNTSANTFDAGTMYVYGSA